MFRIDSSVGMLIVSGALDYERQPVYTVVVMSTDSGVPQLSVTQNLTVHVTDVNEPPSKLIAFTYLINGGTNFLRLGLSLYSKFSFLS